MNNVYSCFVQRFGIQADRLLAQVVDRRNDVGGRICEILGEEYTRAFDDLVCMVQNQEEAPFEEASFYAQFIVYEYAKTIMPDAGKVLKAAGSGIVTNFELKWMLK